MKLNKLISNIMKIIFFISLCCTSAFGYAQKGFNELYTSSGDCVGDASTTYLVKNVKTFVGLDFEIIPDSIFFSIKGITEFKIENYKCIFTPNEITDISFVCSVYKNGHLKKISKTYKVIEKPKLKFEFLQDTINKSKINLKIVDASSDDLINEFVICIFEFSLYDKKTKKLYYFGNGHNNIDLIRVEKIGKVNPKKGDLIQLSSIKIYIPKFKREFFYHKPVTPFLVLNCW